MTAPQNQSGATFKEALEKAQAGLGPPKQSRWAWRRERHRARRAADALQRTTPRVVTDYSAALHRLRRVRAALRRAAWARRRGLWLRLSGAAAVALLRRFGWVFLLIAIVVAAALGLWLIWPVLSGSAAARSITAGDVLAGQA